MQGPSIILASSKPLGEEDIRRIQRIGASDKKLSFANARRFGVGLNSFYHFTDTFELLANDCLYVFDPLKIAVATDKTKKCGGKYHCRRLEEFFPSMLLPFKNNALDRKKYPTIFRLPLRQHTRTKFGGTIDVRLVREYFCGLTCKLENLLIYSKAIHEATVTVVDSASTVTLASLTCEGTSSFMSTLPTSVQELKEVPSERRQECMEMSVTGTVDAKPLRVTG